MKRKCDRSGDRATELARLLRREAARSRPAFSEARHERIMAAVRAEAQKQTAGQAVEHAFGQKAGRQDEAQWDHPLELPDLGPESGPEPGPNRGLIGGLGGWRLELRRWALPLAAAAALALAVGLVTVMNAPHDNGERVTSDGGQRGVGGGMRGGGEKAGSRFSAAWASMTAADPQLNELDQDARRLGRYLIGHVPVDMLTDNAPAGSGQTDPTH